MLAVDAATTARVPRTALLLIDFMNPLDFEGAYASAARAAKAAARAAALATRMLARRMPVIYANDNFGRCESGVKPIIARCASLGGVSAGRARVA